MRFFNWAQAFKETPTCDDILKKVRKVEIQYWIYLIISILIAITGINNMLNAPDNDFKEIAMGLFLAIAGVLQIALIKLWAHIKLTTYFIIWDRNNTIDAEIKKSELQDF